MADDKVMATALRILTRRAHSVNELRRKLFDKGFSAAAVNQAVSECLRLRFLDDQQVAENYLAELRQRGCGNFKIKMMMRKKGIQDEITAALIDSGANCELDYAEQCFKQKLKSLQRETDPVKVREKVFRFMLGRGFNADTVTKLWAELKAAAATEE
jgi:regulatory protein